jgi:hypothetical protein
MLFRKKAYVVPLFVSLTIGMLACQCNIYGQPDSRKSIKVSHNRHNKAAKPRAPKETAPLVEKYLIEGNLADGETALLAEINKHPKDDQLRLSLGSLQFLQAVEKLSQAQYRYGLGSGTFQRGNLPPFQSLSLTTNPNPEALSYEKARDVAKSFLHDLSKAEATLAEISAPNVKLPLHFGMIRLDFNGDGQAKEDETLWKLYSGLDSTKNISPEDAKEFTIIFDRGDVHWLRGYCHLLMGASEIYLAHDTKETFECTAQLFYNKVESPYKFLHEANPKLHAHDDILDAIALIHLIHWPVAESERMMAALHHFEAVTQQSKESWKWIMAETDDDHEWLPNPKQTGVIPKVHVTTEMVDTWLSLMDQTAKILAGERLISFWRGNEGLGVNVRKMFTDPKTFDLVIFLQGPGAAPYLQKGDMTEVGTLAKLQRAFGNQFPGFVIWFN